MTTVVLENANITNEDCGNVYFNPICPDCGKEAGDAYVGSPIWRQVRTSDTRCNSCGTTFQVALCHHDDLDMYRRYGY